jgi:hypothetical protein
MPTVAFVTAKSGGRFEVRETRRTPSGPRATTLATFRVFNDEVLAQTRSRAQRPLDAERLRASARRVGAPLEEARPDRLARALLGDMAGGRPPSPGLRRALADALEQGDMAADGSLGDLAMWIGVPDEARAEALENLLGLADAIPTRRRHELTFPRLSSNSHG